MEIGRLPYSYTGVRQTLQRAADAAGIGKRTTHAVRTWLNQTGATNDSAKANASLKSRKDYGYLRHDVRFGITAASSKVAERVFVWSVL
jgi:hypothetical protein